METVIILLVAAALSAAVVWWASTPPVARRPARPAKPRPPTLRESFQPTGPERPVEAAAEEGFILHQQAVPDERPPRLVSVLRIVVTITFVALLGVGAMAALGLLVKLQIDKYLGP
jgi:hypothetical protein